MDKINRFKAIGTRATGKSHKNNGIPCQDDFYLNNGDIGIICLADGAGSAKRSDLGARLITQNLTEYLKTNIKKIINLQIVVIQELLIDEINKTLDFLTISNNEHVDQFSSTLLLVVAYKNKYISAHLGDGIILEYRNNKSIMHSLPENGEYSNQTYFTTSKNLNKHLRIKKGVLNDTSFAVMSDGAASVLFDGKKIYPQIDRVFEFFEKNKLQQSALDSLVNEKFIPISSGGDDCSIAILTVCVKA